MQKILVFQNNIFIDYFFQNFKILKIRDGWLILPFIINLLLKAIWFYLSSCLRDNVFANPYFCLKPGKHDVTLSSFAVDVSEVTSFPFVRMCQIDVWRVLKIWRWSVCTFGRYRGKTRGGGIAPWHSRVNIMYNWVVRRYITFFMHILLGICSNQP